MTKPSSAIHPRRRHTLSIVLITIVAVAVAVGFGTPQSVSAQEFGAPVSGRRVYDEAGIFTSTEVQHLEEAAARVAAAGAPTVVYIRADDRDGGETEQDAADLMEDWAVESAPGAKDGLVLFFNTDPDDLGHGQFALFAGETHFDGGNLPDRELDRINEDVMTEPIRDDQPAIGLVAGLDVAAQSLEFGPPPPPEPSDLEEAANTIAGWPLGIAGVATGAVSAIWMGRRWRQRPGAAVAPTLATTTLPDRLPPAVAGALTTGSAGVAQAQGTILDLAARGALAFEPEERGAQKNQKVQILLVDDSLLRTDYERELWRALAAVADPSGVITAKQLPKLQNAWKQANATLRQGMEDRGWWDPDVDRRRRPFFVIGGVLLVATVAVVIITAIGEQPFGAIPSVALGLVSLVALIVGGSYPRATESGAAAAAPWLGLQRGLKASDSTFHAADYDTLLPYIMSMNQFGALQKQLKAASADGYVPLAFRQSLQGDAWNGGFFPYFIFFTSSSGPSSSGTAGASAGGAASGGGGSSGSA